MGVDLDALIETLGDDTTYDTQAIVELALKRTREQENEVNRLRVYLSRLKKKGHLTGSVTGAHWKKAKKQPLRMKRMGRPLKYGALIEALADLTVYTPGRIVALGIEKGLLEDDPKVRKRARNALRQLAVSRGFPKRGDGLAQSGFKPAWLGSRWKQAISEADTF